MKSRKRIEEQIKKLEENREVNEKEILTLSWVLEDDEYKIINPDFVQSIYSGDLINSILFKNDGNIIICRDIPIHQITPKRIIFKNKKCTSVCSIKFNVGSCWMDDGCVSFLPFLDSSDTKLIKTLEGKFIDLHSINFEMIDKVIEKIRSKYNLDKNKVIRIS